MKRSKLIVGLTLVAGLAAGSASLVFGQLGSVEVPPVPIPASTPLAKDPVSPAGQPLNLPPGVVVPLPQIEMPVQVRVTKPQSTAPVHGSQSVIQLPAVPPPQPMPQVSGQVTVVPPSIFEAGKAPAVSGVVQIGGSVEVQIGAEPDQPVQPVAPVSHPAEAVAPAQVEVPESASNSETPTGHREPAVSLEWVGPTTARLNQPTPYQIIAKNISTSALSNVCVHYHIPAGVKVAASEPSAQREGDLLTWQLGTLMPLQDKRIELQVLPEAKGAMSCRASVTFTGSSTIKVQVCEPKLQIKTAAPEQVLVGDIAAVAVTVSNPGDGTADHVKVRALLPDGLEHTRGKKFELDLGCLAPGEIRTVQLVCLAKNTGPQQVDCFVSADDGLSAQDVAKVEVVLARLELVVTGPKLRYLDRHASYVLKVTNPGSASANNVSIVHHLPEGFKFDKASHGGRHDFVSRSVSWFIGDLAPGDSREVTLDVFATSIGDYQHKAVATAARGLKTEGEIMTRVEGLSALLMELVDTDDPVEVGSETSYEIRVTNTGTKMETNLELVCTVPEKMEFRGAKCAAGCRYRVEGREVIFEALPRLAPRADVTYRVVVRGIAPGDMRFRARIKADGLSEPVLREESTKVYGDEVTPR
jgi:uncharacterized repeat protein (TIGR01451 family)